MAVLLCGTSGTGKSTLASLLAARLGITTLLSTVCICTDGHQCDASEAYAGLALAGWHRGVRTSDDGIALPRPAHS